MKKFFALLKVSVKSMLLTSSGAGAGRRKKAVTGAGAIALIAFVGVYMSAIYSGLLLDALAPQKMEVLLFVYMGMGALLGGLLFTTFAVKGVVFGGKDNDLLLSMPVSSTLLMTSRVFAIYLENLVFSFFVLVPAGVLCAIRTQSGVGHTAAFWLRVAAAAVLLPLLDTALSVIFGALAALISSRASGGKALGQNLFMGVYLAAVLLFAFRLNGMLAQLASDAVGVRDSLSWAVPLMWMAEGIMGDWGRLLAFAACCILPFGVMAAVFGRFYRKAVTAFQSQGAHSGYKLSAQSAAGQKKALLAKEAKRFFGTPTYLWNAGLGLIMLVGLGIAALVKGELLRTVAAQLSGMVPVLPLCGAVMGFCLSTCIIACPSVSLEGGHLWILREAPVGEGTLIGVKTGFQLLLTLPCVLVCSVCLTAALSLPVWQGAVLFLVMGVFAAGHACFGMLMGLTFPRLDAANETVVVKQSMASLLSIFVPMAALAGAALLCWAGGALGAGWEIGLPAAFLTTVSGVCVILLVKKGPALFRAL